MVFPWWGRWTSFLPMPQAFALLCSAGNRKWYGLAGGSWEEASNAPMDLPGGLVSKRAISLGGRPLPPPWSPSAGSGRSPVPLGGPLVGWGEAIRPTEDGSSRDGP